MEEKRIQTSESFSMAILLAVVGGFFDAYTYVCRDGVFANAQTGNICRLSIGIATGDWWLVVRYLMPILAFIVGISIAYSIHNRMSFKKLHWRQVSLIVEIVMVIVVAFLPIGKLSNIIATIMISMVCAIQGESFRKFLGNAFASTMCTGNLRSASEHLNTFLKDKTPMSLSKSLKYFGVDGAFIVGCTFGTICTNRLGIKAVLICALGLLAAFLMMNREYIE